MYLSEIEKNPKNAFFYMERNVNDGLPGGTRFLNNVSLNTNPWNVLSFQCDVMSVPKDKVKEIGNAHAMPTDFISLGEFLTHPDLRNQYQPQQIRKDAFEVCPTSSARTVYIKQKNVFVKLHYPLILGRVNKNLTINDLINSYQNSCLLENLVLSKKITPYIGFLPEFYGKYCSEFQSFLIMRSADPILDETQKKKIRIVIPAFSLFGRDQKRFTEPTIITQLIQKKKGIGQSPLQYLIFPIISCYFTLLFQCGLQPEMHSQNFLIALDDKWNFLGIILRDIDSIQHDITLMKKNDILVPDICESSRFFDDTNAYYRIKHSFMFDHKFGEFFLLPLLKEIYHSDIDALADVIEKIKEYNQLNFGKEINEYFPLNEWYKFENILIRPGIKRRIYKRVSSPLFR